MGWLYVVEYIYIKTEDKKKSFGEENLFSPPKYLQVDPRIFFLGTRHLVCFLNKKSSLPNCPWAWGAQSLPFLSPTPFLLPPRPAPPSDENNFPR